jgi:NAD(P)-dependent dehydrogenase (short-subunit alcohol dehydrogenase family)
VHSVLIGGSKGLGRVLAEFLAGKGHDISILARNEPSGSWAERKEIRFYLADLFDLAAAAGALQQMVTQRGPIDNLVFLQRARVPSSTEDMNWHNELHVALVASKAILATAQNLFAPNGGAIVFVSSMGGSSFVDSQPLEYGIAKAGINQMVKHYSALLGPRGLRVNSVSCFTFLKDETKEFLLKNAKLQEVIKKVVPLQRMATAADMAKAIAFFCSEDSAFVSGQNLLVDGGLSAVGQETIAFWASGVRAPSRDAKA